MSKTALSKPKSTMNASDAKKMTEDALNSVNTGAIMQGILQSVEAAARSGQYAVQVDIRGKLRGTPFAVSNNAVDSIIKSLRNNGFKVEYFSDQRDSVEYYTISWAQHDTSSVLHR